MAQLAYKEDFIFKVYEMARAGLSETAISKALGLTAPTYWKYKKRRPLFNLAIQKGQRYYQGKTKDGFSLQDYIYRRLPANLRKVWDRINALENKKNGIERIEAILSRTGRPVRQHLFIYAWTSSNFSISTALRKVCISRATFDKWVDEDPDFPKLIEEINWHKKNFFDDALVRLIAGGDTSATIFANRTFNRDRYPEKVDMNINLKGNISHKFIPITELNLPVEIMKRILTAIRRRKLVKNREVKCLPA